MSKRSHYAVLHRISSIFVMGAVILSWPNMHETASTQVRDAKASRMQAASSLDLNTVLMDSDLAKNQPDKFSWEILALISRKSDLQGTTTVNGQTITTNNAVWETWADDTFTFPLSPQPRDPANPPKWSVRPIEGKKNFLPDPLSRGHALHGMRNAALAVAGLPIPPNCDGDCEEIMHNQADFQSIIDNRLWYKEGLACAYAWGTGSDGIPKNVHIDQRSIEIKADWEPVAIGDAGNYHWNYSRGRKYKLVALHIMTKALPQWTWATFEWIGNPKMCASYGCKDSFGYPGGDGENPPMTISPPLAKLLASMDESDEWQYYRLKGSQVNYDRPTLLGNSVIEQRVEPGTASCIGCHARVRADETGYVLDTTGFIGWAKDGLGISPAGKPPFAAPSDPSPARPMGFIWSLLKASPASKPADVPLCDAPAK